jgi:hypothetical protein
MAHNQVGHLTSASLILSVELLAAEAAVAAAASCNHCGPSKLSCCQSGRVLYFHPAHQCKTLSINMQPIQLTSQLQQGLTLMPML